MGGCIRQVAALSGWIMGYWSYTFVLARLGPLHLGCNREVAALLRWLLTQVSLYLFNQRIVRKALVPGLPLLVPPIPFCISYIRERGVESLETWQSFASQLFGSCLHPLTNQSIMNGMYRTQFNCMSHN